MPPGPNVTPFAVRPRPCRDAVPVYSKGSDPFIFAKGSDPFICGATRSTGAPAAPRVSISSRCAQTLSLRVSGCTAPRYAARQSPCPGVLCTRRSRMLSGPASRLWTPRGPASLRVLSHAESCPPGRRPGRAGKRATHTAGRSQPVRATRQPDEGHCRPPLAGSLLLVCPRFQPFPECDPIRRAQPRRSPSGRTSAGLSVVQCRCTLRDSGRQAPRTHRGVQPIAGHLGLVELAVERRS